MSDNYVEYTYRVYDKGARVWIKNDHGKTDVIANIEDGEGFYHLTDNDVKAFKDASKFPLFGSK